MFNLSTRTFASLVKDKLTRTCIIDHLPTKLLADKKLWDMHKEAVSGVVKELVVLERPVSRTKFGSFGVGIVVASLSSMVGRSFGSFCTHKSPIFTYFTNWSALQTSCRAGSIKSNTLLSTHNLHASYNSEIISGMKYKMAKIK
jgi:hypothetical protein